MGTVAPSVAHDAEVAAGSRLRIEGSNTPCAVAATLDVDGRPALLVPGRCVAPDEGSRQWSASDAPWVVDLDGSPIGYVAARSFRRDTRLSSDAALVMLLPGVTLVPGYENLGGREGCVRSPGSVGLARWRGWAGEELGLPVAVDHDGAFARFEGERVPRLMGLPLSDLGAVALAPDACVIGFASSAANTQLLISTDPEDISASPPVGALMPLGIALGDLADLTGLSIALAMG